MSRADQHTGESGFSLLEAVVSFAILALVLSVTFSAGTLGLNASQRAAHRTQALLEAQSLIDRIGIDMPLVQGSYDGTTALGNAYRIQITVDPASAPASRRDDTDLQGDIGFIIRTDIRSKASDAKPLVSLQAFKIAPP